MQFILYNPFTQTDSSRIEFKTSILVSVSPSLCDLEWEVSSKFHEGYLGLKIMHIRNILKFHKKQQEDQRLRIN